MYGWLDNGYYVNASYASIAMWRFFIIWVRFSLSFVMIDHLGGLIFVMIGAIGVLFIFSLHKLVLLKQKNEIKYYYPPSLLSNGMIF